MMAEALVFVPTYNERGNVERTVSHIVQLGRDLDLLFVDDASPDGTGALLDNLARAHPRLTVMHRKGKLGIGSAHLDGIHYAYDHGYRTLITMDCDGTHPPENIPDFLVRAEGADVCVGSRYLLPDSLKDWTLLRRTMTRAGHLMTRTLLGLPTDASSAYRLYRLDRVPRDAFRLITAAGYGFFFESLYVLQRNGLRIGEVPIRLPARAEGHSKMDLREAVRGITRLLGLCLEIAINRDRYLLR